MRRFITVSTKLSANQFYRVSNTLILQSYGWLTCKPYLIRVYKTSEGVWTQHTLRVLVLPSCGFSGGAAKKHLKTNTEYEGTQ